MTFEKHFVTLLNFRTPTIFMCFRSPSRAIFDYHFSEILRLLKRSLPCRTTFLAVLVFKL